MLGRCARVCLRSSSEHRQVYSTAAAVKVVAATEDERSHLELKPFSSIPKIPTPIAAVKGILVAAGLASNKNGHVDIDKAFNHYGPLIQFFAPGKKLIWLKDVEAIEKLLRMDGQYPQRIMIDAWKDWRLLNDRPLGILLSNGPGWKKQRRVLDKKMMRPNQVKLYTDQFNEVITDFVARIRHLQSKDPQQGVPAMNNELFNWSLEMICTLLYETRIGGLTNDRSEEMQRFIKAVSTIFETTESLFMFPRKVNKVVASAALRKHDQAWDTIFTVGNKCIDKRVKEIYAAVDRGEEVEGFLANALASDKLIQGELYSSTAELMMAAVDTTSNTMQWVLECLSRNPEAQQKLRDEIEAVIPDGEIPQHEHITQMPYLRAILKEVLRLYPVATTVTRTLQEDTDILGYNVPADSTILMGVYSNCRDPSIFPDPDKFIPERWLRDHSKGQQIHNFAWLPFGFGSRMCLGRRVAELEIHLLTTRLCQLFELKPGDDSPLNAVLIGLLKPDRPVNVKFIERK